MMFKALVHCILPGALVTGCLVAPEHDEPTDEAAGASDTGTASDTGASSGSGVSSDTGASSDTGPSSGLETSSGSESASESAADTSTNENGEAAPDRSTLATIRDIREGSVSVGTSVSVSDAWVTAVDDAGVFAQELEGGPFSGIFVRGANVAEIEVGDLVDILGEVVVVDEQVEIDATAGGVTVTAALAQTPPPDLIAPDEALEAAWVGVLVRISGTLEVDAMLGGDFEVHEGDVQLTVGDRFHDVPSDTIGFPDFGVGARFHSIDGILDGAGAANRLAPRSAADLHEYLPLLTVADLVSGDLVITEVMYDPIACTSDSGCEWIEIHVMRMARINLEGLVVHDENEGGLAGQGILAIALVVEPGDDVWLGQSSVGWPHATLADGYYGQQPAFNNDVTGDRVIIRRPDSEIIDQTGTYAPHVMDEGKSWQLLGPPSAETNDDPAHWCHSAHPFEGGNGTPGAPNTPDCGLP